MSIIKSSDEIISFYVAALSFNTESAIFLNENFIQPQIKIFFTHQEIDTYKPLDSNYLISTLDFKKVKINYFYHIIFKDIRKDNNGKVNFAVKYGITFDKQSVNKMCKSTDLKYDVIYINNRPAFYYICLDVQEMFSFLRENFQDKKPLSNYF